MRYFVFHYNVKGFMSEGGSYPIVSIKDKFPSQSYVKENIAFDQGWRTDQIQITGFNEFGSKQDFDSFFETKE